MAPHFLVHNRVPPTGAQSILNQQATHQHPGRTDNIRRAHVSATSVLFTSSRGSRKPSRCPSAFLLKASGATLPSQPASMRAVCTPEQFVVFPCWVSVASSSTPCYFPCAGGRGQYLFPIRWPYNTDAPMREGRGRMLHYKVQNVPHRGRTGDLLRLHVRNM